MEAYRQYQQCLLDKKPEEAVKYLLQHLSAHRQNAPAFYQLGNLQRSLNQWTPSLCSHLEACRIDPEQSDYHLNLGVTYHGLQQLDLAIQAYDRAYEKDPKPKIKFNRAQALLQAGRYQEGWPEYEWRTRMPEYRDIFTWYNQERHWRGQPFPRQTLVIYDEQGLGDTLQFCRYLPYVKALGGTVVLAVKAALVNLMQTLDGPDRVVEHCEETYRTLRFHWAFPMMSLPLFCHTTLDSMPNQTPYLSVPAEYVAKWQSLLQPHLPSRPHKKIGFVFACNPGSNTYDKRSCPLPLWRKLFDLPETTWFSLQKGEPAKAIGELTASHPNLIDLTGHIDNFADTAALMEQLDLVISIDTSVAHLAGALDKPTWVLLPFDNEWRWLLRRADSPWYPSMRLFRQPAHAQWGAVLERVRQVLATG